MPITLQTTPSFTLSGALAIPLSTLQQLYLILAKTALQILIPDFYLKVHNTAEMYDDGLLLYKYSILNVYNVFFKLVCTVWRTRLYCTVQLNI